MMKIINSKAARHSTNCVHHSFNVNVLILVVYILHICYMYAVSYCSNIDVYVYVVSAHAELENTNASSLTKKLPKLYSKLKPPYVYKYTKSKMK